MSEYTTGIHNKFARLYFYCNTGLGLINNFRNVILCIFAAYIALKLDNYWYLIIMFLVSLPIITILGWYCVHYLNAVTEWLNIKYGTHYAKKQFALQEETRDLLKEIKDKL